MRKEFQLTQEELDEIIDINRQPPDPVMYLSGGIPLGRSLQEKINDHWAGLGRKHGFKPMTVQRSDKGPLYFTAEVTAE
jgi:hypothetical protein